MKSCCEYCQHFDEDYKAHCKTCREDDGVVNYCNFEFNDEIKELKAKADKWVEKETPLKPTGIEPIGMSKIGFCKCTGEVLMDENYCTTCGQKLDWAEGSE